MASVRTDWHARANLPGLPRHTRTDSRCFTLKAQHSREREKPLADSHRTAGTSFHVGEDNLGNIYLYQGRSSEAPRVLEGA